MFCCTTSLQSIMLFILDMFPQVCSLTLLQVDGAKPSDLGEAVCNITEGEVNAMDEETVYGSMESLCRYTCTASAKRAIVEKMKTKLG